MATLVVNICKEKLHYYKFVRPVEKILEGIGEKYFTRHYLAVKKDDLKIVDKVIICGTSLGDNLFLENLEMFRWIGDFEGAVLGICGGMQIIGKVFGGDVKKKLEVGYFKENFVRKFLGIEGEVEVYHLHQNYVDFLELSDFGVFTSGKVSQAVKHKEKEIYGVLFHPEVRNKELIENFCRMGAGESGLISEVKKKREFSRLPDSVVSRAISESKGEIKVARAILRKYFGVFLTNKVLKGKGEEVLKSHMSSQKRDYDSLYSRLLRCVGKSDFKSIVDFGCGVNGFSYSLMKEFFGEVSYLGIEATGQIVDNVNSFFEREEFKGRVICGDIFDLDFVLKNVKETKEPRIGFLFQVVDALESFEGDFSKKFLLEISRLFSLIVVSVPLESLSKRRNFAVDRKWLVDFLKEKFEMVDDWREGGERFFVVKPLRKK